MDKATEFIEGYLAHYTSEHYDPVKAREYYLRTRELKGRNSGAGLKTQKKKQAWAYAQKSIKEKQQTDLTKASANTKVFIDKARATAAAKRADWSKQLADVLGMKGFGGERKTVIDKINADRKSAMDAALSKANAKIAKIAKEAEDKIAALPPLPKGASTEIRAERKAELDKIRGTASKEREAVNGQLTKDRKNISDDAAGKTKKINDTIAKTAAAETAGHNKKREEVSAALKVTIDKARSDYETLKVSLKAKYEQTSNKEYEAIKRRV